MDTIRHGFWIPALLCAATGSAATCIGLWCLALVEAATRPTISKYCPTPIDPHAFELWKQPPHAVWPA